MNEVQARKNVTMDEFATAYVAQLERGSEGTLDQVAAQFGRSLLWAENKSRELRKRVAETGKELTYLKKDGTAERGPKVVTTDRLLEIVGSFVRPIEPEVEPAAV